ncbi:MAG: FAD:protein FMN transferase [Chryseolinea sp.]
MGNRFEFSVVGSDEAIAMQAIEIGIGEVRRIEALLTTFDEQSQTNRINQMAGIGPVSVDREVFELIERSLRISILTQGAFDITYGSIDKRLWNFDRGMTSLPDRDTARQMVHLINFRNVHLDKTTSSVFLAKKGMRIGFGGIGKGYAADRAKTMMLKAGVQSGIVNAAGDLTVWGRQPDGSDWTVGIADPDRRTFPFASVRITDASVATSGNYEKFVMIDGVKYSHTIDPKTGFPVSGIKSVTIMCPTAELADALATPVTVMGVNAGLNMIDQMKGVACIIIDDNDVIHTSRNINLNAIA